jgi:hypothetical protein
MFGNDGSLFTEFPASIESWSAPMMFLFATNIELLLELHLLSITQQCTIALLRRPAKRGVRHRIWTTKISTSRPISDPEQSRQPQSLRTCQGSTRTAFIGPYNSVQGSRRNDGQHTPSPHLNLKNLITPHEFISNKTK